MVTDEGDDCLVAAWGAARWCDVVGRQTTSSSPPSPPPSSSSWQGVTANVMRPAPPFPPSPLLLLLLALLKAWPAAMPLRTPVGDRDVRMFYRSPIEAMTRETRDERRETRDERRETRDKIDKESERDERERAR